MNEMIRKFMTGTKYVKIVKSVSSNELTDVNVVTDDYQNKTCMKFIPASGAATRMFKNLYEYMENKQSNDFIEKFFDYLAAFPFYEDLKGFINEKGLNKELLEDRVKIIKFLLEDEMNYGNLPKALIKVHTYDDGALTPIDEHIFEGEKMLPRDDTSLHFTISKEHETLFNEYVSKALEGKEHINISTSFQKKKTDTVAVDMNNEPFMLAGGKVLYRAGGHGALIENLNDLDADILFIKNIDNVCHRDHLEETIASKKMLASIGLEVKELIDAHLEQLTINEYDLEEIVMFINNTLHITFKSEASKEMVLKILDRPLKVCGVVKNQGEPGGGPFIVDNGDYLDLQICETVEIDLSDEKNVEILKSSHYFNPVDLVCFVKDYEGTKYNLLKYVNEDRYFISEKTYKGRKLKALEHPGLWNGGMHHWNTLFVEVPLITFNPVKTVNDLLREGHMKVDE